MCYEFGFTFFLFLRGLFFLFWKVRGLIKKSARVTFLFLKSARVTFLNLFFGLWDLTFEARLTTGRALQEIWLILYPIREYYVNVQLNIDTVFIREKIDTVLNLTLWLILLPPFQIIGSLTFLTSNLTTHLIRKICTNIVKFKLFLKNLYW